MVAITRRAQLGDLDRLLEALSWAGAPIPEPLAKLRSANDAIKELAARPKPITELVKQALEGPSVDELEQLVSDAAKAETERSFHEALRAEIAPTVIRECHKALLGGLADEILDSLRPDFDAAAEVIAKARAIVDFDSDPLDFRVSATLDQLEAFQSVIPALATLTRIGNVVMFFSSSGQFPCVGTPPGQFVINPVAEWLNITQPVDEATKTFDRFKGQAAGLDPSKSPWTHLPGLKLATVAEAQSRLDVLVPTHARVVLS